MGQSLQELMTKNPISVNSNQSVQEAAQIMASYNVGSVPVVDQEKCVGIITDRDISLRVTAKGQDPAGVKVGEVMSKNLVMGTPTMDVHQAAELMAQHQIRRLPVVENDRLVGMVALGDLAVEGTYQNEAGEALANISEPAAPQM